jgi:hypothetical protein
MRPVVEALRKYVAYVATLDLSANTVWDEKLASDHDWAALMHFDPRFGTPFTLNLL